jgi:hypothetical protein
MKRLALATMLAAAPSFAQQSTDAGAPSPEDNARRIDELEQRVTVLSEALEAEHNQTMVPQVPQAGQFGMSPAASKIYSVKDGLAIGGYGETIFNDYRQTLQNGAYVPQDNMTDTLRAVLYVGYRFTPWLVFNSEYEWEHSGFSDEHAQGESIVEFAYLDFLLNPAFNVRVGQILLPVGLINELHEPPIFLGVLRPALEQENGIIPTTWHENGVGIHGDLPGNVDYKLYLINGMNSLNFNIDGSGSIGGGRQDGHQAIANKPAFTGRLEWRPIPGTKVGGSFYAGDSAQETGATSIWTTLFEVHGEYRAHGLQARAIYANLENSASGVAAIDPSSPARLVGTEQSGGYVEAGYDVLTAMQSSKQSLIPFVRYEHLNRQQAVVPGAIPDPTNNFSVVAVGANYKPIPEIAFKADYDFETNAALTGRNQFNIGMAYLF